MGSGFFFASVCQRQISSFCVAKLTGFRVKKVLQAVDRWDVM